MNDTMLRLYCPECRGLRPTEQPPCPEGHGEDCPDRACIDCGTALFLEWAA